MIIVHLSGLSAHAASNIRDLPGIFQQIERSISTHLRAIDALLETAVLTCVISSFDQAARDGNVCVLAQIMTHGSRSSYGGSTDQEIGTIVWRAVYAYLRDTPLRPQKLIVMVNQTASIAAVIHEDPDRTPPE